jgi:outer membrane protein OmpA-like peptidoglycan-associated protein
MSGALRRREPKPTRSVSAGSAMGGRLLLTTLVCLGAAETTSGLSRRNLSRTTSAAANAESVERAVGDSANARAVAEHWTKLERLGGALPPLREEFGVRVTAAEHQMPSTLRVHFDLDDASICERNRAAVDRFAAVVQRCHAGASVTVEGFADRIGRTQHRVALHQQRVNAVATHVAAGRANAGAIRSV